MSEDNEIMSMSKPDEKICFIISPIGEKGTPKNIKWKQVRKHIIDPVAEEKGYKTVRADNISKPGKITSQIIDYLRESDLVVADLSDSNPNVFYELGIRDAVRKPVILISDSHFEIPFDVRDLRLLKYSLDLDEIEKSKKELAEFIDSTEDPEFRVISPVTVALMTPADDISATSQDYFSLILEKLNSVNENIVRSQVPRYRSISRPRDMEVGAQLQLLGVEVVNREPREVTGIKDVIGIAINCDAFMRIVFLNLERGIGLVNYDPESDRYWLWEYGKDPIWYYHDEKLDALRVRQTYFKRL